MSDLRDREINAITRMLTLAKSPFTTDFNDQWKVLIYDADGRDIISPLLHIGALRQKGVTLHLMLHSDRESIPDAPAVYFVRPTEENIKRIGEDCAKQLYRSVYLNFITRIERPVMEKLAQDLVATNSVSMGSKIFDQYLDVIALEPNLYTLNLKNSFISYNQPSLSEKEIRQFMNKTAVGLLSMVRIFGSLPYIRSASGGAAEMLAHEFHKMLQENVCSRSTTAQAIFEDCLVDNKPRPLLLIFDRTTDLFPIFQHTSTYQALIHDLLDYKLNRVTLEEEKKEGATSAKKKTYDLNTSSDAFLGRYAAVPFPEAIEANEKEVAEVSQQEAAIRARPDFAVASSGTDALDSNGKNLSDAIESLPEILNKKAKLETHTNILHAVMKKIAAREVPTYFELEQSILTSGGRIADSRSAIISLLKDGTKGNLEDKLRLLAVVVVCGDPAITSKASVEEFDTAFVEGCKAMTTPPDQTVINKSIAAITFLRKLQSLQSSSLQGRFGAAGGGTASGGSNAILSSILTTAQSRASSFMAKAASFFTKFTPYYVTRVVDNLAEGRACPEDETYTFFDPRSRDSGNPANKPQKFSDVIVFVVGGGCYSEFANLQELLKDKSSTSGGYLKNIAYGSTEILTGDDFMSQLEILGTGK